MATFTEALLAAAKQAYCSSLKLENQFFGSNPTLSALDRLTRMYMFRNWQSQTFCNDPPKVPFNGGNCPILYNVTVYYRVYDSEFPQFNGDFEQQLQAWGEIGTAKLEPKAGSPGSYAQTYRLYHHGLSTSGTRQPNWTSSIGLPWSLGNDGKSLITGVSSVPAPGYSDSCPEYVPSPQPYNDDDFKSDITINYTDNSGGNITVPVGIFVGFAKFDANFRLNVPVTIRFSPNFNFNPNFKFDVDVNFPTDGSPPTISPPRPAGDPPPGNNPPPADPDGYSPTSPTPVPPPEIPDPPPPDPDDPERKTIRGVLVTVTNLAPTIRATTIGQDGNPDIYAPRLGNVAFQVQLPNGAGCWTEDIPVKNRRQIVPCPWMGGAIAVTGTPELGVQWTLTPIYANVDSAFLG